MKKNLFVVCAPPGLCGSEITSIFNDINVAPLDPVQGEHGVQIGLQGALEETLACNGVSESLPLPVKWLDSLRDGFKRSVEAYLNEFLMAPRRWSYAYAPANAFFVQLWRESCQQAEMSVRFIYVRDFPWNGRRNGDGHWKSAFTVGAAFARQAGSDILCFSADDLTINPLLVRQRLGGPVAGYLDAAPAAQMLASVVHQAGRMPSNDHGLAELQALNSIFMARHFGAPLIMQGKEEALSTLEWASTRPSAIFHFLGQADAGDQTTVQVQSPSPAVQAEVVLKAATYRKLTQEMQSQLDMAKARIKELEAAAVAREDTRGRPRQAAPASPPAPKAKAATPSSPSPPPATKKAPGRPQQAVAKSTNTAPVPAPAQQQKSSFERKWSKFRRDPALFFADAKNPVVRGLGGMIWR